MLLGKFLGFGDVLGLAGFITPCEQQHNLLATAGEVNPIAGADVSTQFRHATAHAFDITPVPCSHLTEAKNDGGFGTMVFQTTQPTTEDGSFGKAEWVDCIHLDTFMGQSKKPGSFISPEGEMATRRPLDFCKEPAVLKR